MRLAVVASEFNYDVTSLMVERAREEIEFLGAELTSVVKVPGVFDMPLAVQRLMKLPKVDAVVVLGAVIEGETSHDELVANQSARKLLDISVQEGKPLGLGISGPGESRSQAQDRIEKSADAVRAVVKMLKRLRTIS
ncbi:MAG: 6,7-dimethyl-8-ribityllumazine synthase [Candidatus Thermoplasmatota archaeon]|jgi:6,7-dimethyl-8-ribityllumazine synthase|nr:6,7-dimethyl-8-ribityllumazine synthase [Candidatus Thermoplasmatota archaeon]MCL5984353.1 6,7-dimethyl-8-ribityllumazine synthase [Candidatus Thermoplasmatota archaeon]